jgi:hypothetical protein
VLLYRQDKRRTFHPDLEVIMSDELSSGITSGPHPDMPALQAVFEPAYGLNEVGCEIRSLVSWMKETGKQQVRQSLSEHVKCISDLVNVYPQRALEATNLTLDGRLAEGRALMVEWGNHLFVLVSEKYRILDDEPCSRAVAAMHQWQDTLDPSESWSLMRLLCRIDEE